MLEYFEDKQNNIGCRMNKARYRRGSFLMQKLIQ
jgi:hypothetical protein